MDTVSCCLIAHTDSLCRLMKVLLTSHGSTGDIVPMIALGKALQAAGHPTRFATTPYFRESIESAGLEFVRLPPDWDQQSFKASMQALHRVKTPLRQLRLIYRQAKPFLPEVTEILGHELTSCDLLVGSYLFPNFRTIAEGKGAKFATACFCHNVIPSDDLAPAGFPNPGFLPAGLRMRWNRFLWKMSSKVLDSAINAELADVIKDAGLLPTQGFILNPADCVLVAVSPALMKHSKARYAERFHFTGYLRHQAHHDPELEAVLVNFCGGYRVPVITFGSVSWDGAQDDFNAFLINWPDDKRLIVQTGWAGFQIPKERTNILSLGSIAHDQLFRHASVVLHHGGAGTTASALHAGIPQVVAPQIADQNFWAEQVMCLGVGMRASPKGWPHQAPRLLRHAGHNKSLQEWAQEHAETLSAENGGREAVSVLESFCRK